MNSSVNRFLSLVIIEDEIETSYDLNCFSATTMVDSGRRRSDLGRPGTADRSTKRQQFHVVPSQAAPGPNKRAETAVIG